MMPKRIGSAWLWGVPGVYLVLLLVFHLSRLGPAGVVDGDGYSSVTPRAALGDVLLENRIVLAYIQSQPAQTRNPQSVLPVLLLHGSPGRSKDFDRLAPLLRAQMPLLIPDLPGFGKSTREVPDYSFRAHAHYVVQLLDELKIRRLHVVGFSMGGGVALSLADLAPDRVASITLLAAIGVQEMELLGDYHVNHLIHGVQLAGIWSVSELIPHFGLFDGGMLDVPYARNFYDSDQRPLRSVLGRLNQPMLILHGRGDFLVPVEAAREHHRLAPQSELVITEGDHFMVFTAPEMIAAPLTDFLGRVETGRALLREQAAPERILASTAPLDPSHLPKAIGVTALVFFLLLALATLVSEDLTCITAGLMAGQGRISFTLATAACLFGIFIGDLLLFLAGRILGRPAIGLAPLGWFIRAEDVERSSDWFMRRGAGVIFLSRFVPGLRLPTYFAAGVLKTSFIRFAFYFFLACLIWTPLLVGASMLLGGELLRSLIGGQSALPGLALTVATIYLVVRLLMRALTWRGRRLLLGKWRRLTRWEFWPAWIFYFPIVCYIGWLALRFRSLTVFTLANPAIPGGGFIGESKAQILDGLKSADGWIAPSRFLPVAESIEERLKLSIGFVNEQGGGYPVVVKPDAGQRGSGVVIARNEDQLRSAIQRAGTDLLIQKYAEGEEFGVFYYRYPDEERGRILAITEKRFPMVRGDGRRTLEELILADDRAVCLAELHLRTHRRHLDRVLSSGEKYALVELGTHCRGAIFLDGGRAMTSALEERIDCIVKSYPGFYFGRFDLRVRSTQELKAGRGFLVIELNGVTSEATSIYDPDNRLIDAWRLLCRQWRIAFEIGAQHRANGLRPATIGELIEAMREYRRGARGHINTADLE